MVSPSEELKLWFAAEIETSIAKIYPNSGLEIQQILNSISTPKKEFGDISSAVAIKLAKVAKKNPKDVAQEIAKGIQKTQMILEVNAIGGYINALFNEVEYSRLVIGAVNSCKEKYGSSDIGDDKKVLVEFPAVNPNKPWHIGHLRNALLGDSISNILEFCSYKVEREDYIDDLGVQIAEIVWGQRNLDADSKSKKFDQWLGEQYVKMNKVMESSANAKEEISQTVKRMETPGTAEATLSRELSMKCVMAQYETAAAYGIYHNVMVWESDVVHARLLEHALRIGIDRGALERPTTGKNANCITVNLDKVKGFAREFENPNEHEKVIVRSDGTATYIAKDIAFHMWKLGILEAGFKYNKVGVQRNGEPLYSTASAGEEMDFGHAEKVVNIIGSAQKYPQLILKAILNLAGYSKESANITHIAYGEVSVDSGSLSGRTGGWMGDGKAYTADVLLLEAKNKALEATEKSKKIEDKNKIESVSEEVGKAAVKFEYLRVSPEKPVVFSWSSALSFDGNSGPYCMYSYARARRILKKGGYRNAKLDANSYAKATRDSDFELVKLIGSAEEVVKKAAAEYGTNIITDYVIDLTATFSRFYESMQVINSDAKDFRMELIHAYMITLSNMLKLLGIGVVEEM